MKPEQRAKIAASVHAYHQAHGHGKTITYTCAYCGVEFQRPAWQRWRKKETCCCIAHANKLRAVSRASLRRGWEDLIKAIREAP